jgi:hypothetical protein
MGGLGDELRDFDPVDPPGSGWKSVGGAPKREGVDRLARVANAGHGHRATVRQRRCWVRRPLTVFVDDRRSGKPTAIFGRDAAPRSATTPSRSSVFGEEVKLPASLSTGDFVRAMDGDHQPTSRDGGSVRCGNTAPAVRATGSSVRRRDTLLYKSRSEVTQASGI